ncbi:PREDICTED: uncharacterized protein LOC104757246 [Camelina sativa]|uniref:Uncharacterized protein LOC104757246 n=1 Tax=Camelina sativa TaxID=90675 RepID=A0ABM1R627_CAMSA|nr:PREDICTED: uncharacterized protein LOC104757246 [Camelina sativa]
MAQLLSRLSNLSHRNHSLIRLFSSSRTTNPYLLLAWNAEVTASGEYIGDVLLFDAAKEDMLTVKGKTVPQELLDGYGFGASHGWVFYCDHHDRSVCISEIFNPLASKSDPKMVPMPPLTALKTCQNQVFWNVAMSSSPPPDDQEDQRWVVAIKFLGRQLSLCSPRRDLRWTNILTPLDFTENSTLMYSKRDQRFYLPAPGGHHLFSYDLNFKKDMAPNFHNLQFRDLPELPQSEWELLNLCCRTEYLVESVSTGEHFLVKWYGQSYTNGRLGYRTKRFMVFREVETTQGRYMCYTEDIGDICIFLSKSETFCVEASSCPGLQPNSIYYTGKDFGIYDLTTGTSRSFRPFPSAPASLATLFWLPPFSI